MKEDNFMGQLVFWVVQLSLFCAKIFGFLEASWWIVLSPLLVMVGLSLIFGFVIVLASVKKWF